MVCGMKKLAITRGLEVAHENGDMRTGRVLVLNLPAPFYCTRGCRECISKSQPGISNEKQAPLAPETIRKAIDLFATGYGTRYITINGRGDPFHPQIREETLRKIGHASDRYGIQSYVFTAGDGLDPELCEFLNDRKANVMISLLGNPGLVDPRFFQGAGHTGFKGIIAENIRRLIETYRTSDRGVDTEITRLGMNYVVFPDDLAESRRALLLEFKMAAEGAGVYLGANLPFDLVRFQPDTVRELRGLAVELSSGGIVHSTVVNGVCQMGAGSSLTMAANGDVYRCPYQGGGPGQESLGTIRACSSLGEMDDRVFKILEKINAAGQQFACVMRRTLPVLAH